MANNNIGSMLCPNCGKLISKSAKTCIHCGKKNPAAMTRVPVLQNILTGRVSYVQGIFTACIILYILSILIDLSAVLRFRRIFDFLAPSSAALDRLGWTGTYSVIARGRWWTLLTAIYLHGGLLHIFFNMFGVKIIGPTVEELFGSSRFFIIYTISGIIGFAASTLFGVTATVGASGALFGLLGAIVFYGKHRGGVFGEAVFRQAAQWAIFVFLFGIFSANVDNYAHIGGFIGGYLIASALSYQELKREKLWHRRMALICILATVFAFFMAVFVS